jgi:hypothetical protein
MLDTDALLWAVRHAYGAQSLESADGLAFAGDGFLLRVGPEGALTLQVASGERAPVPPWLLAALAEFLRGAGGRRTADGVVVHAGAHAIRFGADGAVGIAAPEAEADAPAQPDSGVAGGAERAQGAERAPTLAAEAEDLLERWQRWLPPEDLPGPDAAALLAEVREARTRMWRIVWRLHREREGRAPGAMRELVSRLVALDATFRAAIVPLSRAAAQGA